MICLYFNQAVLLLFSIFSHSPFPSLLSSCHVSTSRQSTNNDCTQTYETHQIFDVGFFSHTKKQIDICAKKIFVKPREWRGVHIQPGSFLPQTSQPQFTSYTSCRHIKLWFYYVSPDALISYNLVLHSVFFSNISNSYLSHCKSLDR